MLKCSVVNNKKIIYRTCLFIKSLSFLFKLRKVYCILLIKVGVVEIMSDEVEVELGASDVFLSTGRIPLTNLVDGLFHHELRKKIIVLNLRILHNLGNVKFRLFITP